MKKAAIYVRVSTPDQHVESQLYDLRELAVQRGFEVVHEYEDRGFCGKNARRPGLDALSHSNQRRTSSVSLMPYVGNLPPLSPSPRESGSRTA